MAEPATLPILEDAISLAKSNYQASVQTLTKLLALVDLQPDDRDNLICHALEFGPDHTTAALTGPHSTLAARLPPQAKDKIAATLTTIVATSNNLDNLVAAREDILIHCNDTHRRAFVHLGREFTINPDGKTYTYKDSPALAFAFDPKPVEPKQAPEHTPKPAPDTTPTRNRPR